MKSDDYLSLDDRLYQRARERSVRRLKYALLAVGLILLGSFVLRWASGQERDVPSSARREIAMRGNMVERVDGDIRALAGEDLIGQAAETPPDDSKKWHLTVLVTGNCGACNRLKRDLLQSGEFRDWLEVEERRGELFSTPASHMHFHELRYDGAQGRDWGRRLEAFLGRKIAEFPTIVVQPPVDGSFGKHTEIAYLQSGYDGDPAKLTAAMAKGVGQYIAKLSDRRLLARHGGHGQEGEFGATPPPFLLAPSNPPATPGLTFPQTIIPPRVAATVEQIRAACPGCDAEFLLSQFSKQATLEESLAAWGTEQAKKQAEELKRQIDELRKTAEEATTRAIEEAKAAAAKAAEKAAEEAKAKALEELKKNQPTAQPAIAPATQPGLSLATIVTSVLVLLAGGGGLGSLVTWGLGWIRQRRQAAGKPLIIKDDQDFARLVELVKVALNANPAPSAKQ